MYEKILTVSVAAYNVEQYIDECLSKFLVLNDNLKQIEVLIIDDGGTDKTKEIAQKYTEKYPDTFKIVKKENGGWGSTVNKGIELAKGKYFKQLDGDDYYNPESLAEFLSILKKIDVDLVYTPYCVFRDGDNKTLDTVGFFGNTIYNKKIHFEEFTTMTAGIAMHSCTFRTELLKESNVVLLKHCFYTDAEWCIKMSAYIKSVYLAPIIVYYYRLGRDGQSVSVDGLKKHYKEHQKVVDSLIRFQKSNNITPDKARLMRRYVVGAICFQYETLIRIDKIDELRQYNKKVQEEYGYSVDELSGLVQKYSKDDFTNAKKLFAKDQKIAEFKNMIKITPVLRNIYMLLRKIKHKSGSAE